MSNFLNVSFFEIFQFSLTFLSCAPFSLPITFSRKKIKIISSGHHTHLSLPNLFLASAFIFLHKRERRSRKKCEYDISFPHFISSFPSFHFNFTKVFFLSTLHSVENLWCPSWTREGDKIDPNVLIKLLK